MGNDEEALVRLWREKRGEVEPEDLSGNLIVQLGPGDRGPQPALVRGQYRAGHRSMCSSGCSTRRLRWMAATLDGRVEGTDAVFEAKFMLPWSFSEEAAAAKYMPQLQHNMWVWRPGPRCSRSSPGAANGSRSLAHADPLYQHFVTAERKFWRCVENGEAPQLFGVDPPKPRIEAIRMVDMSASNAWAEFAGVFCRDPIGLSRA